MSFFFILWWKPASIVLCITLNLSLLLFSMWVFTSSYITSSKTLCKHCYFLQELENYVIVVIFSIPSFSSSLTPQRFTLIWPDTVLWQHWGGNTHRCMFLLCIKHTYDPVWALTVPLHWCSWFIINVQHYSFRVTGQITAWETERKSLKSLKEAVISVTDLIMKRYSDLAGLWYQTGLADTLSSARHL